MTTYNIKRRILLPLSIAIILLLLAFTVSFYRYQRTHVFDNAVSRLKSMEDLFSAQLENDASMMTAVLEVILTDNQLKAALKSQNRRSLFYQAESLFERLRDEHRITQFYFTGPDLINILRVHRPDRYGDMTYRYTTLNADKNKTISWGIELDPRGTVILRAVAPWYDKGAVTADEGLIGFVELGEEIGHITGRLGNILGVDIFILVEKTYVNRLAWEEGMLMKGGSATWEQFPESVLTYQTTNTLPETMMDTFFGEKKHIPKTSGPITYADQQYQSRIFTLNDAGGRPVGSVVVVRNISDMTSGLKRIILTVTSFCVSVGIVLFFLFHIFLSRQEKQLQTAVAEQERGQAAILDSEERFRTMAATAKDAIMIIDDQGKIIFWNPAAEMTFGYTADEALGKDLHRMLAPERYHEDYRKNFSEFTKTGTGGTVGQTIELEALRRDGTELPVELSLSALRYKNRWHAVGIIRDITSRKRLEAELKQLSYRDGLTGVANRRHFDEVLQREWNRMGRENRPLSMIMGDVDYFKAYNDTHGHQSGDDCLKQVAEAIRKEFKRPGDLVARYGGEEFAVILPGIDQPDALHLAEKVRQDIETLGIAHDASSVSAAVTISQGVATVIPSRTGHPETLVHIADRALYRAKEQGRNRVVAADESAA